MCKFDVDEFNRRWLKARISALHKSRKNSHPPMESDALDESLSESDLLDQFFSRTTDETSDENTKKKDGLLRNVFDHSRFLAMSLSRFLGLSFEIQDFQDVLEKSGIPCVQGRWESRRTARVLTRKGCDFCTKSGANACDYWREALDGLVMGLGDKERMARHASVRHGDSSCIDIFYFDAAEPTGPKENSLAWGALPEHMQSKLMEICDDFEHKMKASILLKGMNEGILYFEFKSSTDVLCSGGQLLTSTFQRKIQNSYPGLRVQEVTPRAVLGVEK